MSRRRQVHLATCAVRTAAAPRLWTKYQSCQPDAAQAAPCWAGMGRPSSCGVLLPLQGRAHLLPDVWIRPPLGGKGRKMTGQLEAHANGFRYLGPKGEVLDLMYRCAWRGIRV